MEIDYHYLRDFNGKLDYWSFFNLFNQQNSNTRSLMGIALLFEQLIKDTYQQKEVYRFDLYTYLTVIMDRKPFNIVQQGQNIIINHIQNAEILDYYSYQVNNNKQAIIDMIKQVNSQSLDILYVKNKKEKLFLIPEWYNEPERILIDTIFVKQQQVNQLTTINEQHQQDHDEATQKYQHY